MKASLALRADSGGYVGRDTVAASMARNQFHGPLDQADDPNLDLLPWQEHHILEGQRQAEAGEFVSESEWRNAFDRHRQ